MISFKSVNKALSHPSTTQGKKTFYSVKNFIVKCKTQAQNFINKHKISQTESKLQYFILHMYIQNCITTKVQNFIPRYKTSFLDTKQNT
jgi:hypothetical protein